MTEKDFIRLENKIDLILTAMGLSENSRKAPVELQEMARHSVLQFKKKSVKHNHGRQGNQEGSVASIDPVEQDRALPETV